MSKRPMSLLLLFLVVVLGVLAIAWLDGGIREQRPIVQPVAIPSGGPGA